MASNTGSDEAYLDEACSPRCSTISPPLPQLPDRPDWAGLTLSVYGGRGFEYSERRPAELAALITRALARLDEP